MTATEPVEPVDPIDPVDPVGVEVEEVGPPRLSLKAVGLWLLLVGLAVALDGLVGGFAIVVVAAVLLARISPRVLGLLGGVALLAVPMAIAIEGIPTDGDVSPLFVYRSLIPHHLTFVGLVWVSAFALLDLAPHLKDWASSAVPTDEHLDDPPPLGVIPGIAVVVVVAVAAVFACMAVLQA